MLPSGLPERVSDAEDLARFLVHRSQFTQAMAKPAAFLPSPKEGRPPSIVMGVSPPRSCASLEKPQRVLARSTVRLSSQHGASASLDWKLVPQDRLCAMQQSAGGRGGTTIPSRARPNAKPLRQRSQVPRASRSFSDSGQWSVLSTVSASSKRRSARQSPRQATPVGRANNHLRVRLSGGCRQLPEELLSEFCLGNGRLLLPDHRFQPSSPE